MFAPGGHPDMAKRYLEEQFSLDEGVRRQCLQDLATEYEGMLLEQKRLAGQNTSKDT
jgi:hypothetical protein